MRAGKRPGATVWYRTWLGAWKPAVVTGIVGTGPNPVLLVRRGPGGRMTGKMRANQVFTRRPRAASLDGSKAAG